MKNFENEFNMRRTASARQVENLYSCQTATKPAGLASIAAERSEWPGVLGSDQVLASSFRLTKSAFG
jgi:hypothetical protein